MVFVHVDPCRTGEALKGFGSVSVDPQVVASRLGTVRARVVWFMSVHDHICIDTNITHFTSSLGCMRVLLCFSPPRALAVICAKGTSEMTQSTEWSRVVVGGSISFSSPNQQQQQQEEEDDLRLPPLICLLK
ncbi:hypothetical protein NC651_029500 [Populus alba x Populus x berolinensis]|nr:hypothetical protein NC651_029500 [Populus alba x Populus x berolinensis]